MSQNEVSVPDFFDDFSFKELSDWLEDRAQLLLLHDENKDGHAGSRGSNSTYVSCMSLFNGPADKIRETVLNFEGYPNYFEQITSASVTEKSGRFTSVKFESIVETPVMSPGVDYKLEFRTTESGDVCFDYLEGDLNTASGRWEFIEKKDQTLVIYTSKFDFTGAGWIFKTMFWAQPDYKIALPVTRAAIRLEQLRDHLTGFEQENNQPVDELPESPDVPKLTDKNLPASVLEDLGEKGTMLYVHPRRWIRDGDQALDFRFVSAIGLMEKSLEVVKNYTTQFERFSELIDQVSNVTARKTSSGYEARWTLDLGVKFIPLTLEYTLEYSWDGDRSLPFHRIGGDLRYVYGALEWEPIGQERTLFFYTMATQISQNDSFLVKLANLMPHLQIVIGVSTGGLAVQKQTEWINAIE